MMSFELVGAAAVFVGLTMLVIAIRHHGERLPRHTAMLIAGMMLTAFGLVLAGFAVVFQNTAPVALNAAQATP
jgi:uncharacterized membrane protein